MDLDRVDGARGRVFTPYLVALVQGTRGLTALLSGRQGDAREAFTAELRVAHADALVTYYMEGFFGFAALAAHDGRDGLAAALEAAAWDHNDRPVAPTEQPIVDALDARYLAPARERLGSRAWERAAGAGRGLTAGEAIALAWE